MVSKALMRVVLCTAGAFASCTHQGHPNAHFGPDWYAEQYGRADESWVPGHGVDDLTLRLSIDMRWHGQALKGEFARAAEAHKGWISKAAIVETIQRQSECVARCYAGALEIWPAVHGRVALFFVIAGDGAVVRSRVHANDTGVAVFGGCIQRCSLAWQFPPPKGGVVLVTYPFDFRSAH